MNDSTKENTLLIVDDEPGNIQMLNEVLKDEVNVVFATSGQAALELLERKQVDLILLDIIMPEMDGLEVCSRIKADAKLADIPIIFVTAMTESEDEERGLALGAIDYITKPFSPPIVKARVHNHLELAAARKKLQQQNQELIEAARLREDVEHITRHDLKNPLSSIIGFAAMIMEDYDSREENLIGLQTIRESGYRMLEMINRSLDMFKMERGTYDFNPQPVAPGLIFDRVIRDNKDLQQGKSIRYDYDANKFRQIRLMGEELIFYSMLSNLLRNALEASPENETISFNCEKIGQFGRLSIRNKGTISNEVKERFFEKLFTSGKRSGTGLGTYSAKLVAETCGGKIALDIPEEGFVEVSVTIPLAKESD